MDVEAHLAQLERLLADARPLPLSASVMVNRKELDDLLADLRAALPDELRQSRWVLKERDELLAQAEREREQTLDDARLERDRLVGETEIVRASRREAERILDEAREQARVLRLEAEDYVDGKLANFEIVLAKTMKAVEKGRERLRGRLPSDELAEPVDEEAPDEGYAGDTGPTPLYDYETSDADRR